MQAGAEWGMVKVCCLSCHYLVVLPDTLVRKPNSGAQEEHAWLLTFVTVTVNLDPAKEPLLQLRAR